MNFSNAYKGGKNKSFLVKIRKILRVFRFYRLPRASKRQKNNLIEKTCHKPQKSLTSKTLSITKRIVTISRRRIKGLTVILSLKIQNQTKKLMDCPKLFSLLTLSIKSISINQNKTLEEKVQYFLTSQWKYFGKPGNLQKFSINSLRIPTIYL